MEPDELIEALKQNAPQALIGMLNQNHINLDVWFANYAEVLRGDGVIMQVDALRSGAISQELIDGIRSLIASQEEATALIQKLQADAE